MGRPAVAERGALWILRNLILTGHAGLDQYDDARFVVVGDKETRQDAEEALDAVGAKFIRVAPPGVEPSHVECELPASVRRELGLDDPDAPRLDTPLASRAVSLDKLIDEVVA